MLKESSRGWELQLEELRENFVVATDCDSDCKYWPESHTAEKGVRKSYLLSLANVDRPLLLQIHTERKGHLRREQFLQKINPLKWPKY